MLLQGTRDWFHRHQDSFRAFGTFPGGGGFGVVSVDDNASLHRMMAELPFAPFSDTRIDPFVEGDEGFVIAQEVFATMMQSMQGS